MFTCTTCTLTFDSSNEQRDHMRSDWHRYNLKRRVAQLPAISETQFTEKVAAMTKAEAEEPKTRASKKEERQKKREELAEKKKQILDMARKAMQEGRKRESSDEVTTEEAKKDAKDESKEEIKEEVKEEVKEETETEPTEDELISIKLKNKVEIPPTTCLFCKKTRDFDSIDENIAHMFKAHGLYMPEKKYLEDISGLLNYLGEKVGFGFCIACNYQGRTCEAAREHMISKRHMRIPYETEDERLEISQFYDFSSSYAPRPIVNAADVIDDGDWEDVEGDDDNDDDNSDEELLSQDDVIYRHGNSLVLPSGQVLGHRMHQRYYKQALVPEKLMTEGQGTVIAAETRHMMSLPDRQAVQEKKREWARQKKREDINDRRAARFVNNQPYYRDELLQ